MGVDGDGIYDAAMKPDHDPEEDADIPHPMAILLGNTLLAIRKATGMSQEKWEEKTGLSQSHLSNAENGKSGWKSLMKILNAIERAGIDPLDLFRITLAKVDGKESESELMLLWSQMDDTTKEAVLILLRSQAALIRRVPAAR